MHLANDRTLSATMRACALSIVACARLLCTFSKTFYCCALIYIFIYISIFVLCVCLLSQTLRSKITSGSWWRAPLYVREEDVGRDGMLLFAFSSSLLSARFRALWRRGVIKKKKCFPSCKFCCEHATVVSLSLSCTCCHFSTLFPHLVVLLFVLLAGSC